MKRLTFLGIVFSIIILAGVSYANGFITVDIDIKPGNFPNSINWANTGLIPVAILTTEDFDATTIDPTTVVFGPGSAMPTHREGHIEDVDGDGDIDLLLHFITHQADFICGDLGGFLMGETYSGEPIRGVDTVNIVRCN